MNKYFIDPQSYLARAKNCIEKQTCEDLFYAAFELRCFVEQRQAQYLDAQKIYTKSIPKHWKLSKQTSLLQKVYESKQIQVLRWNIEGQPPLEICYVPVSRQLLNSVARIDRFRHAQKHYRSPEDVWWITTRKQILELYKLCWLCNCGNMLSPALISSKKIVGDIAIRIALSDNDDETNRHQDGMLGVVEVLYLDSPPDKWICDIST